MLAARLEPDRTSEALADLRDWGLERISHHGLMMEAWSLRGHVSAYDALYVAAARARTAALVTADGPLSRAPGLGVAIHNIRLS